MARRCTLTGPVVDAQRPACFQDLPATMFSPRSPFRQRTPFHDRPNGSLLRRQPWPHLLPRQCEHLQLVAMRNQLRLLGADRFGHRAANDLRAAGHRARSVQVRRRAKLLGKAIEIGRQVPQFIAEDDAPPPPGIRQSWAAAVTAFPFVSHEINKHAVLQIHTEASKPY